MSAKRIFNYLHPWAIKVTLKILKILMKSELQKYRFMTSLFKSEWPDEEYFSDKDEVNVVVIVGLHEGETALNYLERIPNCRIIGFEPNPDAFSIARSNLSKFGERVQIYNKAIGASEGKGVLNRYKDSGMNSILDSVDFEKEDSIEVEISTLDTELKNLKEIDVLQVDVQGMEIEVFCGTEILFREGKVNTIVTEAMFKRIYEGQPSFFEIGNFLEKYFVFHEFISMKFSSCEPFELMWVDAVFKRNLKNSNSLVSLKVEY